VVVAVLAALGTAGYAVSRSDGKPGAAATTSPAAAATTASPQPSTPPSAPATAAVVPFLGLPIGSPPSADDSDDDYPWHRLSAVLVGPHTVAAGSTATFTVRLHNPTSAPISLDPCPAYDLEVGYQTMSYGLNCAGAPDQISAGATVAFALLVPMEHSLGGSSTDVSFSLGWQPDTTSPHAHLLVKVNGQ
jgi:hypothetical protein